MNIEGFSAETAKLLIKKGGVENFSDLYALDKQKLLSLDGFQDTKAENLLRAVEKSKNAPLSGFIYALGIDNVGKKTAKDLAERFGDVGNLMAATRESLTEMDDVGEIVADSIVTYFADEDNVSEINKLFAAGVRPETERAANKNGAFAGEKVVLTGTLSDYKRDEASKIIEAEGGEVVSSVSKLTTLVLAGENAGSKLDKARALGIKIIDEETFKSLIKS